MTSVHTHFGRPFRSDACAPALHHAHPPSPHLRDDDVDGDIVHSASQYHHPSSNPFQTSLLHLTTRRTALVCGRYNKLEKRRRNSAFLLFFPLERQYVLFDFFLPRPSLSTTASSHATRGPLRGPPLSRRVPAGGARAPESSENVDASRCSAGF